MTVLSTISGSIVIGQSQSNALVLGENHAPVAITTGSNITATTLTFLTSNDNVTFTPLYDNTGTEVSLTSGSFARTYALDVTTFYNSAYLKLRGGTSASAVNQTAVNTPFVLVTRYI
jgi:hypothetical protein